MKEQLHFVIAELLPVAIAMVYDLFRRNRKEAPAFLGDVAAEKMGKLVPSYS